MRREDSFERFYLRHVAIGEGCGCAEQLLRTRDPALRASGSLRELAGALRERLARGLARRARRRTDRARDRR